MSNKELEEFNDKVAEGAKNSWDENEDFYVSDPAPVESEIDAPPKPVNNKNAKMWAIYGNTYSPCEKSIDNLPCGQFTIESSPERGVYFVKRDINLDDLMHLPDSASEEVIEEIKDFWTKEQHFRNFGFLWKRGVMLWGPPGSGKTSTVQLLSQLIDELGGLSIYVQSPHLGAIGLDLLRRIEPDRPIVVILEDIDSIAERFGEPDLLSLLDGELQVDNVVFIATTNYPERLDKRLTNRPSRFDIVKKIGMPSRAAREVYLRAKNKRLDGLADVELNDWVDETDGFSIAHIKELIISVEVFGVERKVAIARLRAMMDTNLSSDDGYPKKGFGFTTA